MVQQRAYAAVLLVLASASAGVAFAQTTEPVVSLRIAPAELRLDRARQPQQLLVTAIDKNGLPRDVTHHAQLSIDKAGIAVLDETTVRAVAAGRTYLVVRYESVTRRVPIVVHAHEKFSPIHFANDIMPLFSKHGCNSGGCHGKQAGQNGFKLSIFGFDPHADYEALVYQARGRRLTPAQPDRSLLVTKATGRTPHGGGARIESGSAEHASLIQWIRQGMPWGADDAPQLASLVVEPMERVLGARADQQVLVTAVYSDGTTRDVTSAASYSSNETLVAEVTPQGHIHTGTRPGEAAITVSYMGQVSAVRILVPRQLSSTAFPELAVHNPIDPLVWAKLKKMNIWPSELCDDATFLRRLYLDTIGTLPKAEEVREFLTEKNPDWRQQAIDRVLARDELADYWSQKWADILMVDRDKLGARGAYEFHRWLRQQIAVNRPYNEWTRDLITASGNSGKHGPVNFYRVLRTPEELTKAISQSMLGIRMDCAQCHHHPFEKWGQHDFYAMAGFFRGMQRKPLGVDRELVYHAGYQQARMPLSGEVIPTRPPGGKESDRLQEGDPRVILADWITGPRNPWFARLVANRLWKHFLGRGLIEPEDDLRSTNPATNEALLNYLTGRVVESGYDLRQVMREILGSRVYQLSSKPNESNRDDEQAFSHRFVRRMPAPVLLDAVSEVTGSDESYVGMPPGTRAIELWDNRLPSYFLDSFGRSERRSPCECGSSGEPTMAQALHLMNAPEIEAKIGASTGRVAKLIDQGASRQEIIDSLCLAALGRPPNAKELAVAKKILSGSDPRQEAEDFLWTLLNSYEFLFIH